ncbi:MAG TPA: ABC transporter permease [Acetobacteraceae bacterium]|nr:ABC transporter permease [Acetobacteraceae bacterium]
MNTLRPLLVGALLPILAAVLISALLLVAFGVDPFDYYGVVVHRGLLTPRGLQDTIIRMAPLMLIAASLIVSFRAGLWNLGTDGQYLLAAVVVAASCPLLDAALGHVPALLIGCVLALATGALWAVLPAMLRAWQGVNEIITTLMMSFLGTALANALVKLALRDPAATVPQTRTLPVADRLPRLFGTTVGLGVPIALVVLIAVHLATTHTAWGLRLRTLGANPRAARHAGIDVPRTTVMALVLSGAIAGLAGGIDIVGVWGNVRADWNPAYGLSVIPLVFLARLNGWAVIGFVLLFSMLSVGAESASIHVGVPSYFSFVLVALILLFLALAEWLGQRRQWAGT